MFLCLLMQTVLTVKRDPRVFLIRLFVVAKQVKHLANRVTREDQNTIKAEHFMIFLLALGSSWSSLSSSLKTNDRSRSFEGSLSLSSDSSTSSKFAKNPVSIVWVPASRLVVAIVCVEMVPTSLVV